MKAKFIAYSIASNLFIFITGFFLFNECSPLIECLKQDPSGLVWSVTGGIAVWIISFAA